jgi:hypothetical protein
MAAARRGLNLYAPVRDQGWHVTSFKGIFMTNTVRRLAGATLILCACVAGAAAAQTAPAGGEDKSQTPPPQAAAAPTGPANCIDENDGYTMRGKQPMFEIELTNKCEQRFKCRVFAYITNAKGASQGRGTLVLRPKSSGAGAKKTYRMKTKMNGGSAQLARECRAF